MRLPALLAVLALTTAPALAEDEKRELDAHEHGHVELKIAVDGQTLSMQLEAPGENIVGFEHEAKTAEQKAAVDAALKQFKDPTALFTLPDAAGCAVASNEAEIHQDGDHNAFEASYSFECSDIAALATVETKLFALYPSIEEIDVDFAVPAGQGSQELEADSAVVNLPSTS